MMKPQAKLQAISKKRRPRARAVLLFLGLIVLVGFGIWSAKDSDSTRKIADTNTDSTSITDNSDKVDLPEDSDANNDSEKNTNDGSQDILGESVVAEEILGEPAPKDENGEIADKDAAKKRDEQRINDMETIRDAMKKYYDKNSTYPGELGMLVPEFLDQVPENPSPGGAIYSLTGIGAEVKPGSKQYKYYDLVYVLEVGAKDLEPGMHVANPDGIAVP